MNQSRAYGKQRGAATLPTRTLEMTREDPIDRLRREHGELLREVEKISHAAASIRRDGFSAQAFQTIAAAARLLNDKARQHSEAEDRYLFPLLERHAGESPVVMRHEGREMWRVFNELLRAVKDVEDGRIHGTTIRELLALAHIVVEEFKNHFERENNILFPLAHRLLTPEEHKQLAKDLAVGANQGPPPV